MLLTTLYLVCLLHAVLGAGSAPNNINVNHISYMSGGTVCVVLTPRKTRVVLNSLNMLTWSTSSINTALSTAVDSKGRVYVAGSGPFNFRAHAHGSGDGYVMRLKTTEASVDGIWRFSSEVTSIRLRDVGGAPRILIQGQFGVTVLDQTFKQLWNVVHSCGGSACKSDIATDGTVSLLLTSGHLYMYSKDGHLLGDKQLGHAHYTDTAIDPARKMVFYSEFFQSHPHKIPVQVPCIIALNYNLNTTVWTDYCISGEEDYETHNMADSRVQHLFYNDHDGKLYFSGYTDGGNSIFRYDPYSIQQNHGSLHGLPMMSGDQKPAYDQYVNTYNMHGATSVSVGGRLHTAHGSAEEVQFYIARLSSHRGNSVKSVGVTAGINSVMFMAQSSVASIDNRDSLTVNNMHTASYGGYDGVLLGVPKDFNERLVWHVFTKTSGHAYGVSVAANGYNGKNRVAFVATSKDAEFLEVKPLQGTKHASSSSNQYVLVVMDL